MLQYVYVGQRTTSWSQVSPIFSRFHELLPTESSFQPRTRICEAEYHIYAFRILET